MENRLDNKIHHKKYKIVSKKQIELLTQALRPMSDYRKKLDSEKCNLKQINLKKYNKIRLSLSRGYLKLRYRNMNIDPSTVPNVVLNDMANQRVAQKDQKRALEVEKNILKDQNSHLQKDWECLTKSVDQLAKSNNRFIDIIEDQKEQIEQLHIKNHILANKSEELKKIALTDNLTELYNRHYLNERLDFHIRKSIRTSTSLAFVLIDIDKFKVFNDTYGHVNGDIALVAVSTVLKNAIRRGDIAGRWGGEEFCIICPSTSMEGAKNAAERIRKDIEASGVKIDGQTVKITASLGVNSLNFAKTIEAVKFNEAELLENEVEKEQVKTNLIQKLIENLFKPADHALYRAKDLGRNRTVTVDELDDIEVVNKKVEN